MARHVRMQKDLLDSTQEVLLYLAVPIVLPLSAPLTGQ